MKTSGHLVYDGGIRGHSAGDFYPYRVMAQGNNSLRWWVINPNGKKEHPSWSSAAAACGIARLLHATGVS